MKTDRENGEYQQIFRGSALENQQSNGLQN